jgi:2-methylisocitrate lyase-like PEP mutase family enzyme
MTRQEQKAAAFRALHAAQPFVIPNPWNAGSARILEALGFRALATTSSGFAFTLGRRDGEATARPGRGAHGGADRATMLPLSVDLENGYGTATHDVAQAVTRVAEAGAVGCSIEDYDPPEGSTTSTTPPNGSRLPSTQHTRFRIRSYSQRGLKTTSAAIQISTTRLPASRHTSGSARTCSSRPG